MLTITEALAEIKTINKRVAAKQEFIQQYLFQLDNFKDPLEKDGGSEKLIAREVQAINDLEQRVIDLRQAIRKANETTLVRIEDIEKTIADWLVWRREVAPDRARFLRILRTKVNDMRDKVRCQAPPKDKDVPMLNLIVNVDESAINKESERIESILSQLDGQLSLKNATIMLD